MPCRGDVTKIRNPVIKGGKGNIHDRSETEVLREPECKIQYQSDRSSHARDNIGSANIWPLRVLRTWLQKRSRFIRKSLWRKLSRAMVDLTETDCNAFGIKGITDSEDPCSSRPGLQTHGIKASDHELKLPWDILSWQSGKAYKASVKSLISSEYHNIWLGQSWAKGVLRKEFQSRNGCTDPKELPVQPIHIEDLYTWRQTCPV